MSRVLTSTILILLSLLFISCKPENRIDISKEWKIIEADSPDYKNPAYNDSSWKTIDLPEILIKEKKRRVIWLRKTFFVPADYKDKDLAVEIGRIWDADNTYINEIKIGSAGSEFPDFFSLWNYDRFYSIPEKTLRYGENNVICIRIFSNILSFYDGSPFISELRSVRTYNFFRRLLAEYIVIGLTMLSVFSGIVSLAQYITYKEFKLPLYYSIGSILVGIMSVQFYLPDVIYISYITKDNLFYTIMTLVITFFYFLLETLLHTKNRIFRIIVIILILIAIVISLTSTADDPIQGWRIVAIGTMTLITCFFCFTLLIRDFIKNKASKELLILALGYTINMFCVTNDILMMENIIRPGIFLTPVAFNILFVCFGTVLSFRTSDLQSAKLIAEKSRDHYLNEMNLAKKIQDQLIPSASPSEHIHALYKPLEDIGGDFYDFIQFENSDKIGIFISDVSGHGLPAAFITSMLKTTILQSGSRKENPAQLLTYINEVLFGQTADNFITAFYCIYDPSDKTLKYANAGHPQPYLITDKNISQLPKGNSTALAFFPNDILSGIEKSFINFEKQLEADSRLLLYTDGLTDTRPLTNGHISFETTEMIDLFSRNKKLSCRDFIENLHEKLIEFRGSDSFEDDICLVCLDII